MEIKISTKQILNVLHILSWIIFIGLCINAGGFIFNSFFVLVINPLAAQSFWEGMDLSSLYNLDRGFFITQTLLMIIVAVLKAILFYLLVKIIYNKKLDFVQPFNTALIRFVFNASYVTLGIGMFSYWGASYTNWLTTKGVTMPSIQSLGLGGGDVWLFMGIILLVISQIFKRGAEIQAENDLTV